MTLWRWSGTCNCLFLGFYDFYLIDHFSLVVLWPCFCFKSAAHRPHWNLFLQVLAWIGGNNERTSTIVCLPIHLLIVCGKTDWKQHLSLAVFTFLMPEYYFEAVCTLHHSIGTFFKRRRNVFSIWVRHLKCITMRHQRMWVDGGHFGTSPFLSAYWMSGMRTDGSWLLPSNAQQFFKRVNFI